MASPSIVLARFPHDIYCLTLNRPAARNALNWEAQTAFRDTLRELCAPDAPPIRALIIRGAGEKAFCAGGDLVELSEASTRADGERLCDLMGEGLALLAEAPFITLAAINGHALGGGAEIAFSCDWRVMEKSAKMGFLQVDMALTTGWGGGARLLAEAGYARALDILSSGTAYPAEVWQDWGLVQKVVGTGKAYEEALAWAQTLAEKDLVTLHALKTMLKAGRAALTAVLEAERALFPDLWAAPAHAQAVQAFLDRKK